jgi:hypothetical protein
MEAKRDPTVNGGTCVPSFGAQERELVDPAGDGIWVAGPGHWGWDRIELRSAGWRTCGETKYSRGSSPDDTRRRAGRMHVA